MIIRRFPQAKWAVLIVGVAISFLVIAYLVFSEIVHEKYGRDSCGFQVPRAWLIEPVSVEEAEAAHRSSGLPFGYEHENWESLKSQMTPADTLWSFNSPSQDWLALAGRRGYAVVRFGVPIDCILTLMN